MVRFTSSSLAVAGLLATATLASAAPATGQEQQQLVLGDIIDSAVPASSPNAAHREPDFIDVLQAEAKAKGIELDLGLDHTAQKAQEAAHRAALAAQNAARPHASELLDTLKEEEEWDAVLPDGDLEEIEDVNAAASHAAEMYAAVSKAAKNAVSKDNAPWISSIKLSKPSHDKVSTKGEPGSGWIWKTCALEEEVVKVDSIDVTPDPPKPGKNMTVRGKGVVSNLIDEGSYVDVVVKIGLIKLLSRRFDLCEEARNANATVQCPVQPGVYDIEQTVALPREIPPAKFNVHLTGSTQAELDLLCLDLSINFMHI